MKTTITIDPKQRKHVLHFGKLTLTLDADQIYVNEPGLGTPMLFCWDGGETMTWACGFEGGNLCEIMPSAMADRAIEWAHSFEDQVYDWEQVQWDLETEAQKKEGK